MDLRPFRVDPQLLEVARDMRSEQTPAEKKLWRLLRNRRLNGFKFRRQFVIDRYVADFFCAECKLVVELDGPSHFEASQAMYDIDRTSKLNADGYTVIRFRNGHVHENPEGVLKVLWELCEKLRLATTLAESAPHPNPLPMST